MLGEEQKPPRYPFAWAMIPPRTLRVLLMALLAQYQNIATDVWRMYVADITVRPGLRGGERHGHLRVGLDNLFNPKLCDLKAMGVVQLIDERELHFLPLVHHHARWQPD